MSLRSNLSLAFVSLLAACSDGGRSAGGGDVCDQYLACLEDAVASAGPAAGAYRATLDQARVQYGPGGACDATPAARQQCQSSCAAGLGAAHNAFPSVSACQVSPATTSPGPDPVNAGGGGSGPCKAYLSCVLQTAPSAYAAALQIYGTEAACWDTPAQSAACDQACTSELAERKDVCSCSGDSCTAFHSLESGEYAVSFTLLSSDPTCPARSGMGPADLYSTGTRSYRLSGEGMALAQGGPFGPSQYSFHYEGELKLVQNGGTATWYLDGSSRTSQVTVPGPNQLRTDIDWYGDGDCIYRVSFTQ